MHFLLLVLLVLVLVLLLLLRELLASGKGCLSSFSTAPQCDERDDDEPVLDIDANQVSRFASAAGLENQARFRNSTALRSTSEVNRSMT